MRTERYTYDERRTQSRQKTGFQKKKMIIGLATAAAIVFGFVVFKIVSPSPVEKAISGLEFDSSVTEGERQLITEAIKNQSKTYSGSLQVSIQTVTEQTNTSLVLSAYVPVTHVYAGRQNVAVSELKDSNLLLPEALDQSVKTALVDLVEVAVTDATEVTDLQTLTDEDIALIPAHELSKNVKLLKLDGTYYLDDFTKGAIFRQAVFSGDSASDMDNLKLNELGSKDSIVKVNMTGVTALTRLMQRKLDAVKDPLYFSTKIGTFMADADITHVSNEVSFRESCQYSNTLFCSPPTFIETLKASGVDLVELTGNHNNDNGSMYNTQSIELYHSLGMHTFGGGLNADEARKPHVADLKGSKITFIGYNMADGAGSGAIAGATTAGANIYTEEKARADIAAAKQNSQFIIVNIQYAECQAYPSGYIEFPECDRPIGGQQEKFRNMIDLGADMVIGSSAHQPQTYELYEGKPIYYGLGNMYFEQVQWPGTERGIILTHYFEQGKLLQTKLTPTVYDRDFQTMVMDETEAVQFLNRLGKAR